MILDILKVDNDPENILGTKADKISKNLIPLLKNLILDMDQTRFSNNGVGLAAPQIGKSIQLCIVSHNHALEIMINPIIEKKSENLITLPEQCLSIPNVTVEVPRHEWIEVSFFNQNSKYIANKRYDNMYARICQHEIDHLNGITILNYRTEK